MTKPFQNVSDQTFGLFANPANRKLIADLESAGAEILRFPIVDTAIISAKDSAAEFLKNPAEFDWLIFPDVLTVDYFLEILEENAMDLFELDAVRVCAFGEAVADRLRFASLHADIISSSIESETVFAAMLDYIGESALSRLKILFLQQFSSKNSLSEKLKEKGAIVTELPIYKTESFNKTEIIRLKTLLKNGAADEFIFTAPTDFIWLEIYFKNENLLDVFADLKISVIDGVMFQSAKEHNFSRINLFHFNKTDKVKA